jgi:predicted cupin superfamily sugar epimerase
LTQGMENSAEAKALITALGLAPHPEGGWYRETLRLPAEGGGRAQATAIQFLLEAGSSSHWHRVDATEIWLWHAGAPLSLGQAPHGADKARWTRLGPDILSGERVQAVVPAGHWQAAIAEGGWALVSCIVAPGFEFDGFELAAPGWRPGGSD